MAIRSSCGFSYLRPVAFLIVLQSHKTQYTQPRGWKKRRINKHGLRLAPNTRKEKFGHFPSILCFCVCHKHVLENSNTATRNADSSSHAHRPGLWYHRLQLLTQQLPFSDHCLSPTVAYCSLLLTALGPCLSLSFSGLVGNLAHKPFVWVSRQNRQRNPLTGTQPHPQKRMPPIVPHISNYCMQTNN